MTEITERYVRSNTQEAEWENHLDALRGDPILSNYRAVEKWDGLAAKNEFEEAAEQLTEKIMSLQGSLYTEEGKKEHLKQELKNLANEFKSKNEEKEERYNQKIKELEQKIARKLTPNSDLSEFEAQKRILQNSEFEAEIKNNLFMKSDPMSVAKMFSDLVKDVEYTGRKSFGRYLLNNAYLFMERIEKLDANGRERASLVGNIMANKSRLEKLVLSDKQKALKAMKEKLKYKSPSSLTSNRLIDMSLNTRIRKL